jgi:hypothetical protein
MKTKHFIMLALLTAANIALTTVSILNDLALAEMIATIVN